MDTVSDTGRFNQALTDVMDALGFKAPTFNYVDTCIADPNEVRRRIYELEAE